MINRPLSSLFTRRKTISTATLFCLVLIGGRPEERDENRQVLMTQKVQESGEMRTLHLMLIRFFMVVFIITVLFFALLFQLVDIFSYLWRYIANDVSLGDIGRIALLYFPKCVSLSLPIALLFSITYSLGILYTNNELISIFGSGINLYRLILPFIFIGILLSPGSFFFEESFVIQTLKAKNQLVQMVLNQTVSYSNSNVTVISSDNRFIYQVNYYNDKKETLSGLTLFERDENNHFLQRIDAESASWNGVNWDLRSCRIFSKDENGISAEELSFYSSPEISENPSIFRRSHRNIDEMEIVDAKDYVYGLRKAGSPYREALSQYYARFSASLTPLIVILISSSLGGLFKKNILIMSLIFSLCIAVLYFVIQMVTMTLARNGLISPLVGAFSSFFLFLVVGIILFKFART